MFAFEPVAEVYQKAVQNLKSYTTQENGCRAIDVFSSVQLVFTGQVRIFNHGLSNAEGQVSIRFNPHMALGSSQLSEADTHEASKASIREICYCSLSDLVMIGVFPKWYAKQRTERACCWQITV